MKHSFNFQITSVNIFMCFICLYNEINFLYNNMNAWSGNGLSDFDSVL